MREATPEDTRRIVRLAKEMADASACVAKYRTLAIVAASVGDAEGERYHSGEEVAWEAARIIASSDLSEALLQVLPSPCAREPH